MQGCDFWQAWAQALERRGLKEITATFLEAVGPVSLLLSQLTYFSQPFFGKILPAGQWEELGRLLEDRSESQRFAAFLREEEIV
jgi:hypothetical protein